MSFTNFSKKLVHRHIIIEIADGIYIIALMYVKIWCITLGKVEMITGVGRAMSADLAQWRNTNRPIVSSGVFGRFMVSPAEAAIFVINGETRTVNCEIGSLVHPRLAVWVTRKYI